FHSIGKDPRNLSGILVTHEHSDHIKGLGIFARKYNLPIYAKEKTWSSMEKQIVKLTVDQCFHFEANTVKTFGHIDIESFSISHDAVDPMVFNYDAGNKKVSVQTDLAYVSDDIKQIVKGADAYALEAMHDIGMLQIGHYPSSVKRRTL